MRPRPRIPLEAIAAVALALVLGCSDSALAASVIVYQCSRDGVRAFSDRPCGMDAQPQRVESAPSATVAAVEPPGTTATPAARQRATRHAAPAAKPNSTTPRGTAAQCHGLKNDIDAIDTRMRLGYRGKEGTRLQARRDTAVERYRALRCNTTAVRPPPSTR
ncbi:MAG: hypothetical protein R3E65_08115 [Steroidobacteraceae bacterium]